MWSLVHFEGFEQGGSVVPFGGLTKELDKCEGNEFQKFNLYSEFLIHGFKGST